MSVRKNGCRLVTYALGSALLTIAAATTAYACTGITLKAADATVVRARTLEFGIDIKSEVVVIPRGFERAGDTPDGKDGLKWKAKYASVGANGLGLPYLFDGVNEKGLSAGVFYFPGSAGYMAYRAADAAKTMAPWQLGSWVLDSFASIDEVKANLEEIVVPAVVFPAWGFSPPAHFIVTDASGKSIVIEYVDGKLNVHDNLLGVVTNSPGFDWHMTNLRNYVNLSMDSADPVKMGSVTIDPLGQGSGMLGLPGDFTPPSRFVRAVAFTQSALPSETGRDAVLEAFHVLNQFDVPKGAVREAQKDKNGNVVAEYTLWTSANDLQTKRFYFRTHENSQIRFVDLMKMNLDGTAVVTIPMSGDEEFKELAP